MDDAWTSHNDLFVYYTSVDESRLFGYYIGYYHSIKILAPDYCACDFYRLIDLKYIPWNVICSQNTPSIDVGARICTV